eukprot:TRINITY_DN2017_c0_g1_i1.p3 TRINITY_DN2017_c0_g1~~TRINITY_DN2017_c0_g1_i1.p3  ORF type:complete len:161 (-),score=15.55 TRINITY_DN2017_c0_g1_i1:203-685(-)
MLIGGVVFGSRVHPLFVLLESSRQTRHPPSPPLHSLLSCSFSRSAGDGGSVPVNVNGSNTLVWAYSQSGSQALDFHGRNDGSLSVDFSCQPGSSSTAVRTDTSAATGTNSGSGSGSSSNSNTSGSPVLTSAAAGGAASAASAAATAVLAAMVLGAAAVLI